MIRCFRHVEVVTYRAQDMGSNRAPAFLLVLQAFGDNEEERKPNPNFRNIIRRVLNLSVTKANVPFGKLLEVHFLTVRSDERPLSGFISALKSFVIERSR